MVDPTISLPCVDYFQQPFMDIWGMVYDWVYHIYPPSKINALVVPQVDLGQLTGIELEDALQNLLHLLHSTNDMYLVTWGYLGIAPKNACYVVKCWFTIEFHPKKRAHSHMQHGFSEGIHSPIRVNPEGLQTRRDQMKLHWYQMEKKTNQAT